MKKLFALLIALTIVSMTAVSFAGDSRTNKDIQKTETVDVIPEDPTEEVVLPEMEIVPEDPVIDTLREELQTIYRLTIYYVYADGSTAAPTYDTTLQAGEAFSVPSPDISGYTPTISLVSGIMPERNLQYRVIYLTQNPDEENPAFKLSEMLQLFSLVDYETALGLGFSIMNIGLSME